MFLVLGRKVCTVFCICLGTVLQAFEHIDQALQGIKTATNYLSGVVRRDFMKKLQRGRKILVRQQYC